MTINIMDYEFVYFKICCGINSVIRFYDDRMFVLLQNDVRGHYIISDNKLVLIFMDGTKDIFDITDNSDSYSGDGSIGGKKGVILYRSYQDDILDKLSYSDQQNFGVCIGTYGSVPHIHLQLETAKRLYHDVKLIIIDDCSKYTDKLKELCDDYNCDFVSSPHNLGHMRGDVFCVSEGIRWAKKNNISYLYKLSRRFIPCINIIDNVKSVINQDYATYSNICDWGIRSECFLMNVNLWEGKCLKSLDEYVQYSIRCGLPHPVPEVLYTKLCKRFYYSVSKTNNKYTDMNQNKTHLQKGCVFGILPFLTPNRSEASSSFLWHSSNTQEDFKNKANLFNLPYSISDYDCYTPQCK